MSANLDALVTEGKLGGGGLISAMQRETRYAIERKHTEKKITRLSSLYAALRRTNQDLGRVTEPRQLLDRICEIAVRCGGFCHAAICLADVPGGALRLAAQAHRGGALSEGLRLVAEQATADRMDPGASGSAHGDDIVFNDLAQCTTTAPWRALCMAEGVRSVGLFSVRSGTTPIGVLTLLSDEVEFLDHDTAALVKEMARDLSSALDNIAANAKRELTEQMLRESEERYRLLFSTANDALFMFILDENGLPQKFEQVNDKACTMFGYTREELLGLTLFDMLPPEDVPGVAMVVGKLEDGAQASLESTYLRKDGSRVSTEIHRNVRRLQGHRHVFSIVRDISDRVESERELRLASQALEASANGIVIIDALSPDLPLSYVNPAFERITGYSRAEVVGRNCRFLQGPEHDQPELQEIRRAIEEQRYGRAVLRNYRKDGSLFWNELAVSPVRDPKGKLTHFVGIQNDVTEFKRVESELVFRGSHDSVTGVANRHLLQDRMTQAIALSRRSGHPIALLHIHVDGFKVVNDALGHDAGDAILRQIAARIAGCAGDGDTLARLSGGEFILLCSEMTTLEQIETVCDRAMSAFTKPIDSKGDAVQLTCSIGVSSCPKDACEPNVLLSRADQAMRRAKESAGSMVEYFTAELEARATIARRTERELREAIEREEFELFYQPQIALETGNVIGVEALIRWHHPERGLLAPAEFIDIAEETGLIVPIGDWVITAACKQAAAWQIAGHTGLSVSVNVSAKQLRHPQIVETLRDSLSRFALDPRLLEIELTESLVMEGSEEFIDILKALKRTGVAIAIDDFGVGYSSLSYLKRFPIDRIKIDRAFIRDIVYDPDDAAIVKAIIAMAHQLGLEVTAEGVETDEQASFLRRSLCGMAQGYLFGRPTPAAGIGEFLSQHRKTPAASDTSDDTRSLLLVDDEENVLKALKRVLRRDGYQIYTASSAIEALELLAHTPVAVIVSDQRMPQMSGTEFLRRVASMHPNTIRIMLSGYTDLETVTQAVNEGALYKFLTKPWDDESLRDDVRKAFRRHAELRGAHATGINA